MIELDAFELYKKLREVSGAFYDIPDFSEQMIDDEDYVKFDAPEGTFLSFDQLSESALLLGIKNEWFSKDDLKEQLKGLHGYSDEKSSLVGTYARLGMSFYSDNDKKILNNKVKYGFLPKYVVPSNSGSPTLFRLSNALVIPAANNTFLVGMTTQFQKIIWHWSTLMCAANPDGSSKIGALKIFEGIKKIINEMWVGGNVMPTWELGFLPGDVISDKEWFLRSQLCSMTISFFFTHHELGHIVCNHTSEIKNDSFSESNPTLCIQKRKRKHEMEYEADTHAIGILCNGMKKLASKSPDVKDFLPYQFLQLVEFFAFLESLEKMNSSEYDTHPPAESRGLNILEEINKYNLPNVNIGMLKYAFNFARERNNKLLLDSSTG